MWTKRTSFICLCFFVIILAGCSSASTNSESTDQPEAASSSGADEVGSIPEDVLASDENQDDASASSEQATESGDDPFKDLKDGDQKDSTDVAAATDDTNQSEEGSSYSSSAGSGEFEEYTVKSGDTLMKIAFKLYGDLDRWNEIYDLNRGKIKKASSLAVGSKLKYEKAMADLVDESESLPHHYTIKRGDTLANIADELYGRKMKYKKLQKYNSKLVKDVNRIYAGFILGYDITPKEMAEAEARRAERMATNSSGAVDSTSSLSSKNIPSAIQPVPSELNAPTPQMVVAPPAPSSTTSVSEGEAPQVVVPPPPPQSAPNQ